MVVASRRGARRLRAVEAPGACEPSRCQALANSRLIEQSRLAWRHCSPQETDESAWHLNAYLQLKWIQNGCGRTCEVYGMPRAMVKQT